MLSKFYQKLRKFVTGKEEGASMAEYALLLLLITVALVVVIGLFSDAISGVFQNVISTFNS